MLHTRSSDVSTVEELEFEDISKLEGDVKKFVDKFYDEKFLCSECDNSFIVNEDEEGKMIYYTHPQGLQNGSQGDKYWIYIECPNCQYQHSFEKIIYNSNFSLD